MTTTKIGLGLAALGRPDYINIRAKDVIDKSVEAFKTDAIKVLDESYQLGIRDFDVAPSYGLGEEFLLEWNSTRNHSDVNLSTKFGYTYVANWNIGFSGKHEIKEHSLKKLNAQWQVSKAMLPNLKIYQIHSATLDSGVLNNTAVLSRLNELKQKHGLQIGLSSSGNAQLQIIEAAQKVCFDGVELFDSYQVTFNIFEQSCSLILSQLLNKGKTIIIKEALANGRLFRHSNLKHYESTYNYLELLSKKYSVGIDAIAIRFIIDSLQPTLVLSGVANSAQLKDNLKSLTFKLHTTELSLLKGLAISPDNYWTERGQLRWN
ncbi:aldo/keto reductase [Winogradskyella sp.]|nr:aldo/keto reductase [Winogradskyella sp.]MDB9754916.1 aldo/keto reductase [Winogradskyella sp.]MDC1504616.1 aldo/keto reductase [Winogradskyella sp.]